MHVLLTGAASVLGPAVAMVLAEQDHRIRATDDLALPQDAPTALAADFRQGELTDPDFAGRLLDGVEAIVHLAPLSLVERLPAAPQEHDGETLDAAARGTHVLYKAATASGIAGAVQGSTLAIMDAYGERYEVTEQWRPRPHPAAAELAPYLAELAAREFTRDVQLANPLSIICLRFATLSSTAGPEDLDSLSPAAAADAVARALTMLAAGGERARQRGHRWHLYHVAPTSTYARYSSAAAQSALGYGAPSDEASLPSPRRGGEASFPSPHRGRAGLPASGRRGEGNTP